MAGCSTRRAARQNQCEVEPTREAEHYININSDPQWLVMRHINEEIGRGVFLTERRLNGSFLVEYSGDLIPAAEGQQRQNSLEDESVFRFFLKHMNKSLCIDATVENNRMGRLCNHATGKSATAKVRVVVVNNVPHVCLFAKRDMDVGDQVLYDYGVRLPFVDKISCRSQRKRLLSPAATIVQQTQLNNDVSSVSSAIVHSLPEIASPLETKTMAETKDAGTDLLQAAVGKRRRERLTRADSATLKQQKPLVAGLHPEPVSDTLSLSSYETDNLFSEIVPDANVQPVTTAAALPINSQSGDESLPAATVHLLSHTRSPAIRHFSIDSVPVVSVPSFRASVDADIPPTLTFQQLYPEIPPTNICSYPGIDTAVTLYKPSHPSSKPSYCLSSTVPDCAIFQEPSPSFELPKGVISDILEKCISKPSKSSELCSSESTSKSLLLASPEPEITVRSSISCGAETAKDMTTSMKRTCSRARKFCFSAGAMQDVQPHFRKESHPEAAPTPAVLLLTNAGMHADNEIHAAATLQTCGGIGSDVISPDTQSYCAVTASYQEMHLFDRPTDFDFSPGLTAEPYTEGTPSVAVNVDIETSPATIAPPLFEDAQSTVVHDDIRAVETTIQYPSSAMLERLNSFEYASCSKRQMNVVSENPVSSVSILLVMKPKRYSPFFIPVKKISCKDYGVRLQLEDSETTPAFGIENLSVRAVSHNVAFVQWDIPDSVCGTQDYRIFYDCDQIQLMKTVRSDSRKKICGIIDRLLSNTTYTVFVVPTNAVGDGSPSLPVTFTTKAAPVKHCMNPEAQTFLPQALRTDEVGSQNLAVAKHTACRREKKKCPVKKCGAFVVALPRHLKLHGWTSEEALNAVQKYGLRKKYEKRQPALPKYKDYHKARECPIDGCGAIVKRLPPHLRKHHGICDPQKRKYWQELARKRVRDRKWLDTSSDSSSEIVNDCEDDSGNNNAAVYIGGSIQNDAPFDDSLAVGIAAGNCDVDNTTEIHTDLKVIDRNADSEFAKFKQWLLSPDGGAKSEKSARQHAFQVKTIVSVVDPCNKKPSTLLEAQALRDKFFVSYVQERQFLPGTTKSYLNSVVHWCKYVVMEYDNMLSSDSKLACQALSDRVKRWINSLRKQSQTRYLQKMDDDLSKLISPEEISQFNSSESAIEAVKLLGTASLQRSSRLSESEYVLIRDFLLCKITFNNANRSGVMANMTTEQFKNAKLVDGHHVVSVTDHKTASCHGPAKIILTPVLFAWLSIFVSDIRPSVLQTSVQEGNIFLSCRGEAMTSGQITKAMQSVWAKAGLKSSITCTLVRKTAVSAVHKHVPDSRANLADLMSHRLETATKSYRLADKNETTVSASRTLVKIMHGLPERTHRGSASEGQPRIDDCKSRKEMSIEGDGEEINSIANMEAETSEDRVQRLFDSASTSSDMIPPSSHTLNRQRIFSDSELEYLKTQCQSIIESGSISSKRITEALNTSLAGKEILKKFKMIQLMSRLKYQRLILRNQ